MGTIQNVKFHSPLSHFSFMLHTIVTDWPQLQDSNWNAMVLASVAGTHVEGLLENMRMARLLHLDLRRGDGQRE